MQGWDIGCVVAGVEHSREVPRNVCERKQPELLYRKDGDGRFVLVGAMYTAPKRFSPDKLDARPCSTKDRISAI